MVISAKLRCRVRNVCPKQVELSPWRTIYRAAAGFSRQSSGARNRRTEVHRHGTSNFGDGEIWYEVPNRLLRCVLQQTERFAFLATHRCTQSGSARTWILRRLTVLIGSNPADKPARSNFVPYLSVPEVPEVREVPTEVARSPHRSRTKSARTSRGMCSAEFV